MNEMVIWYMGKVNGIDVIVYLSDEGSGKMWVFVEIVIFEVNM